MSTSNLAIAKDLEKYWSFHEVDEGESRFSIDSVERLKAQAYCDDYPFAGQVLISGSFTYTEPGRRGYEPEALGWFEYRSASNLFLLQIKQAHLDPETVREELDAAIDAPVDIDGMKTVSRECLWNFFDRADEINEITVRDRGGESTLHSVLLSGESLDESGNLVAENRFIKSAKAKYIEPNSGQPIIVKYSVGELNIPHDPARAREYVIQLFEREVIHPQFHQ